MPHSKDPNRYDPGFAEVLSYMEEGREVITIDMKSSKRALSFKMRLYGYAEAWKAEGLAAAKSDPERSKLALERAKIMARYRLTNSGTEVICESRDRPGFEMPSIRASSEVLEKLEPQAALREIAEQLQGHSKGPLVPKENLSDANKSFLDLLEGVDKPGFRPRLAPSNEAVTAEDLNGPQENEEDIPNGPDSPT